MDYGINFLGRLIDFNNLISATQKHLSRSHDNVEAKERRVKALGETIALIKKTIEKVPASASTIEYLEWLYWWTTKGSKEVEKVQNNLILFNHDTVGTFCF